MHRSTAVQTSQSSGLFEIIAAFVMMIFVTELKQLYLPISGASNGHYEHKSQQVESDSDLKSLLVPPAGTGVKPRRGDV